MSALPKIFRWVFTVLAAATAFAAAVVLVVILVDPHLPPGTHLGPLVVNWMGEPASVDFHPARGDFDFAATALRGDITLFVAGAGGLLELVKHFGLPLVLVQLVFFTAVFELLRRLFRNVGRGDSFIPDTVRLVQILGSVLIAFSFILSFAEGLFAQAVFAYVAHHAVITVSGTPIRLPYARYVMFPHGGGFPFGSPLFFSGLLVLALSEVFRQGLALKKDSELTI